MAGRTGVSRLGTPLAVAAVAALVLVAALDAVRGDGRKEPDGGAAGTTSIRADLVGRLAAAGARGTLVFADERCRLRALRLPTLARVAAPVGPPVGCRFELSPDGLRVAAERAAWNGPTYAICRRGNVEIRTPPSGLAQLIYRGCAPAWRPAAGRPQGPFEYIVTLARGGRVLEARPVCAGQPPCERLVLARADLRVAALEHPTMPSDERLLARVDVLDLEWLDTRRAAAVLGLRFSGPARRLGRLALAALFVDGRVAWTRPEDESAPLTVERSPAARYVVVAGDEILRVNGSQVGLPPSLRRGLTALAWSPDEAWVALANRNGVVLVPTAELERFDNGGSPPTTITLPFGARDVALGPAGTVRP